MVNHFQAHQQYIENVLRRQSFEVDGVHITVRESLSMSDDSRISSICVLMKKCLIEDKKNAKKPPTCSTPEWNDLWNFAAFMLRTTAFNVNGNDNDDVSGFAIPCIEDSIEDVWYPSFYKIMRFPRNIIAKWDKALVQVNKIEPDPEAPAAEKKTKKNG